MNNEKRTVRNEKSYHYSMKACLTFFIFNFSLFICLSCGFGGDIESLRQKQWAVSTFNVATYAQWEDAVVSIQLGGNDRDYTINVTGDFSVSTAGFFSASGITVTLQGAGRTLFGNGSILIIGNNQTVILQDLALRGDGSNNSRLVGVSGGTFIMNGGEIFGSNGGGVWVSNNGTFTMNGGEISGDTTSSSSYGGGGVYVEGYNYVDGMSYGTFTMNGGIISGNSSTGNDGYGAYGGGVHLEGLGATFIMLGGEISGNTASSYGGGVYLNGGTFTMNGGEISGNTASSYGGGVIVGGGTFTMNGGEISGNTASYSGGGVIVGGGTFTMNDGKISGNTSSHSSGGGVIVGDGGTFTMNGGEISDNTANTAQAGCGGGVSVDFGGTFTMNGGEILRNNSFYGGGVYVFNGILRIINGTIYGVDGINPNTAAGDAALRNNGSAIAEFGIFNGEEWISNGTLHDTDNTIKVVNGELLSGAGITSRPDGYTFDVANPGEWYSALSSIDRYGSNKNYTINVTADFDVGGTPYGDYTFGNASNVTVTLQGSGRTLTLSGYGSLLQIYSNQTVILQNLILQGNDSFYDYHRDDPDTVVQVVGGTFIMYGGKISGNNSYSGGGVYIRNGSFTMQGGEISGNTSNSSGGGVSMNIGTFRMVTGTIYGSDEADTSLKNVSSGSGAALSTSRGTAEYGIFSGEEWINNGTLLTTSNTIRVVNGVPPGISDNNTFNVTTSAEWDNALNAIAACGSNNNYTINVTADFSVEGKPFSGVITSFFGTASNVTVTLQGEGRVLALSGMGNLLQINNNQTVILQNLILQGNDSFYDYHRDDPDTVVQVVGGTFIMYGGKISGNNSYSAGGVYIRGGSFTMEGGEISGNTSSNAGGGVYVGYSGTFRMVTGTIYGSNEADASLRNTASSGAALSSNGTAEYGTFSESTWNSNGTLNSTDDTIRVVNGVLQ
jgi:hypothetical protein